MNKEDLIEIIEENQKNIGIPLCFEISEEKVKESLPELLAVICNLPTDKIFGVCDRAEKYALLEIFKKYIDMALEE